MYIISVVSLLFKATDKS